MNDRLDAVANGGADAVLELWNWELDPDRQLRKLEEEVRRQFRQPGAATRAFMVAAESTLLALPEGYEPVSRCLALLDIGASHYLDAHPETALTAAGAAVRLAVVGKDTVAEARARMVHGVLRGECYDFKGALTELELALELARRAQDH